MTALSIEEFEKIPPQILSRILLCTGIYTFILIIMTMTIFSFAVQEVLPQSCDGYHSIYYTSDYSVNETSMLMSFYETPVNGSSTVHVCNELVKEKAGFWISVVGIGIFIVYLFHAANNMKNALATLGVLQVIAIEICGLKLLFEASSAVDVILNSSATIFLAEVDDIIIELFIHNYLLKSKAKRFISFGGLEIEIDESELAKADEKSKGKGDGNIVITPMSQDNSNINMTDIGQKA